jgi:hypothetical protein
LIASWDRTSWLRSVVGVRGDYFRFGVDARTTDSGDPADAVSGLRHAMCAGLKGSAISVHVSTHHGDSHLVT